MDTYVKMAPKVGLEPTTYSLTGNRSAIELHGNVWFKNCLLVYYSIGWHFSKINSMMFMSIFLKDFNVERVSGILSLMSG
jgi:hypothetical protein